MRSVSIAELEKHLPEVSAGERLTLVHGGKAVAEIVPLAAGDDDRAKAAEELIAMMEAGIDLEGVHIENRDELYDRHAVQR